MGSFVVIKFEPLIEVFLQHIDGGIEFRSEGRSEELIQDSPIEAFHKAIGLRSLDSCLSVFDFIQR